MITFPERFVWCAAAVLAAGTTAAVPLSCIDVDDAFDGKTNSRQYDNSHNEQIHSGSPFRLCQDETSHLVEKGGQAQCQRGVEDNGKSRPFP